VTQWTLRDNPSTTIHLYLRVKKLWKFNMTTFLEYYNVDLLEVIETEVPPLLDTSGKFSSGNT